MKECSCHTGRICGYHANQIDRIAQRDNQIDAARQRVVTASQNPTENARISLGDFVQMAEPCRHEEHKPWWKLF